MAKAHGFNNLVITWGDLSVCFGCVVTVKSTRQDSTMSLSTSGRSLFGFGN